MTLTNAAIEKPTFRFRPELALGRTSASLSGGSEADQPLSTQCGGRPGSGGLPPLSTQVGRRPAREMGRTAPSGINVPKYGSVTTCKKEPPTMSITRIGLDTAKAVFQVHGVDETGKAIMKRKLQRSEMLPFPKKHPLGRCQARLVAAQIPGTLPVVEDYSGHAACSDLHSMPHRDRRKTCHAGAYCRREQRSCARWR